MRNEICKLMPKEIEMMGATFPVSWFYRAACRYVTLQTEISSASRSCDVTDLVQEAIIIGLERQLRRADSGKPSLAGMPEPYLRRTAANLVHQAARKNVKWHKRISQSQNQDEADLWESELRNAAAKAGGQSSAHDGLYGLYPVEEILSTFEEQERRPLAKHRVNRHK